MFFAVTIHSEHHVQSQAIDSDDVLIRVKGRVYDLLDVDRYCKHLGNPAFTAAELSCELNLPLCWRICIKTDTWNFMKIVSHMDPLRIEYEILNLDSRIHYCYLDIKYLKSI